VSVTRFGGGLHATLVLATVLATMLLASNLMTRTLHAAQDPPSPDRAALPPAGTAPGPTVGPTVDENDDNDNAARRARVNATAKLELPAGTIEVIYPLLPANGPDAEALAALGEGEVLELTRSMALKLKTRVELRLGDGAVARTENVSPGYPGVYSLWLRRHGDGWSLVLNREPDIWGTMRDPAADVGEAPIAYRLVEDDEARSTLEATLVASNGGGQLSILWGRHRWTADFEAGAGMPGKATGGSR
jgi:hypothetical protein